MKEIVAQIKEYLAGEFLNYGSRDIHSVVEFLYWHYTNCNQLDTERIDAGFHEINETMAHMSLRQQDIVVDKVNELCTEFEKHGFCQGFHIGVRLMAEVQEWEGQGRSEIGTQKIALSQK